MTCYGAKELAASFRTVRKNTLVIANDIGEEHYGFSPAPGSRTVAQLLVHIAVTPRMAEQIHAVEKRTELEGFDFGGLMVSLMAEEQKPRTKAEILTLLTETGDKFAGWLEGVSDEFLGETVTYPAGMTPPVKSRIEMIMGVKEHEMHHRGQLMLIERMVGVIPHFTRAMHERFAAMQSQKANA